MKDDLLEATIGQSLNISSMLVTFETFQSFNHSMLVTFETFQSFNGWLKDEAPWNIYLMLVTFETSQSFNGWLKDEAP